MEIYNRLLSASFSFDYRLINIQNGRLVGLRAVPVDILKVLLKVKYPTRQSKVAVIQSKLLAEG